MKSILLLLPAFVLISLKSYAQGEMPAKDGKVIYEYIDSSITGDAGTLYSRAKIWLADAFKDSKEVIQVDDKDTHTLMGKGLFQFIQTMATYSVYFTVNINTKDNKYRIQFYDIRTEVGTMRITKTAEKLNEKKGSDKMKEKINEGFYSLMDSFKVAMLKKPNTDF